MKRVEKFVVVPFRQARGRVIQGEPRYPATEEGAVLMAERLSEHWDGVAAVAVIVDADTGEFGAPRELACYGIARQYVDEALAA